MLVSKVMVTGGALESKDLASVLEALLVENDLREGLLSVPEGLDPQGASSSDPDTLVIERLSDVSGVNALAPGQSIDFNSNLTILFGENGCGKTGYTRVLKRIAGVRTAEEILPNVHSGEASTGPSASIAYSLNEARAVLEWNGEAGVPPFTRLSVFDSPALTVHVDNDLSYVYTPSELALFAAVTSGLSAVQELLSSEIQGRGPVRNPFLGCYAPQTAVYTLLGSLSARAAMDDYRKVATSDQDDLEHLRELRANIAALTMTDVAGALLAARAKAQMYQRAAAAITLVSECDFVAYGEAEREVRDAQSVMNLSEEGMRSLLGLTPDLDVAWRAFIMHGESYRRKAFGEEYPNVEGAACLYCRQPLTAESVELVCKYVEYANEGARSRVSEARVRIDALVSPLKEMRLDDVLGELRIAAETSDPDEVLTESIALLEEFSPVRSAMLGGAAIDPIEIANSGVLLSQVMARVAGADATVTSLSGETEERSDELKRLQTEERELGDRVRLYEDLEEIQQFVENLKWIEKAQALHGSISRLSASLTRAAKRASNEVLNADFESRFRAECERLRAPSVGLEFPGQRGQTARRKTVPKARRPSQVLSEGEQKVIALADFLAEASLHIASTPLLFDDPVNSLDYRRIGEVARRISLLSRERQVIVFTHNIWFVSELLSHFEKDRSKCSYYKVCDDPEKGMVIRGANHRIDSIGDVSKRVNGLIGEMEKVDPSLLDSMMPCVYSEIRTWCEVFVESELLGGVTQRHKPNVAITCLPNIRCDRLPDAFSVVLDVYERSCRVISAHSQPLETLSVRPSLSDLRKDWQDLLAARRQYSAK